MLGYAVIDTLLQGVLGFSVSSNEYHLQLHALVQIWSLLAPINQDGCNAFRLINHLYDTQTRNYTVPNIVNSSDFV